MSHIVHRRVPLLGALLALALCAVPVTARAASPGAVQAGVPAERPIPAVAASRAAGLPAGGHLGCTALPGLPLCSHGDDTALRPSTAAAGGGGAPASTSNTRIGCYGNGRDGARVQAVYARPAGAPDRYPQLVTSFRGWAGAMDQTVNASAAQTNGQRHIRFATTASGSSCVLDVVSVTLPSTAFRSFADTVSALQRQGLDQSMRKYLVWADVNTLCAVASTYADDSAGQGNANNGAYPTYARVDTSCWGYAETHELLHMLGAVQPKAPHATAGFHCRDGLDLMCYDDGTSGSQQMAVCGSAQAHLLDCRHDDYFSTAPAPGSWLAAHWNTANSAFLGAGWTDPAPRPQPSPTASPKPTSPPSPSPAPLVVPTLPTLPSLPALPPDLVPIPGQGVLISPKSLSAGSRSLWGRTRTV